MSTYYDFMVEAKYEGKWYNIDFHTKDIDGKLRHQYLATISRSFIGLLEDQVNGAYSFCEARPYQDKQKNMIGLSTC